MLYGTIFGDMAGSTYEFRACKNYSFTTIPEKSHFTDDTVMTLAVASWLMKDPNDINILVKEMQYFGNRYPRAGYGGMFRKWLIKENPEPYNSFGNGSAMRVSPCAWVAKSLEEAENLAEKYQMDKDEFLKAFGGIDMIKYDLTMRAAIDVLKGE